MPFDAVFELREIRSQSERAFEFAEAGLGLEEGHVELPELRGSEALGGLQNRVSALGERAFHFLLVAGDLEPSCAVLERVESVGAGAAFLEGLHFAFDNGGALEDAFFNALAEGVVVVEESLLGAGNHGFLLEAALGAAAQDQAVRGILIAQLRGDQNFLWS